MLKIFKYACFFILIHNIIVNMLKKNAFFYVEIRLKEINIVCLRIDAVQKELNFNHNLTKIQLMISKFEATQEYS